MNLDHLLDFNRAVRSALEIGILHVETSHRRVPGNKLMAILSGKFGAIGHRRFHVEILNRAYGLAFVNQKKMGWVESRNMN